MSVGYCPIPGMSQPLLDRCEGCVHNKGLVTMDCELYCYGVEKTDGAGMVLKCEDFEPSPEGDAQ